MSVWEKVGGLLLVVVICGVFCVVFGFITIFLTSILSKWTQKRINPFVKFPRNPKGETISVEKQRALNVGAILAEVNSDFCDSLQTSKKGAKRAITEILTRDWEITSTEQAIERLEKLKSDGHRKIFNVILKNVDTVLAPDFSFETINQVYEQVGFSLLSKKIQEECGNEIAILEKNINMIFDASSFEEINNNKDLFGDDETYETCIGIYLKLADGLRDYAGYVGNLKATLSEIKDNGFIKDESELKDVNVAAWDMGRIVNVARYAYDCGYFSEEQAWEYIFYAENESKLLYDDWADFGRSYVIGRSIWGGKGINLSAAMSTVKLLKEDPKSPWLVVGLK